MYQLDVSTSLLGMVYLDDSIEMAWPQLFVSFQSAELEIDNSCFLVANSDPFECGSL